MTELIERLAKIPKGFWLGYRSYRDWDMLMFQGVNLPYRHFKFFRCLEGIDWIT